jgi:predicted DNA-binding transcriptional regulator AlpA
MSEKYITRKELAYALKCSLSTIDRNIKARRLPFDQIIRLSPRRVVFPVSILEDLKKSSVVNPKTQPAEEQP